MDSNLPAMACTATITWGIGLGTRLSYVPAPQHRAGPMLWGRGRRSCCRLRAPLNPLGHWHGMVWKAEVQQVVPTGTNAAGRKGAGGGCVPHLMAVGDCCPYFKMKVEKWER